MLTDGWDKNSLKRGIRVETLICITRSSAVRRNQEMTVLLHVLRNEDENINKQHVYHREFSLTTRVLRLKTDTSRLSRFHTPRKIHAREQRPSSLGQEIRDLTSFLITRSYLIHVFK